MEIKIIRSSRRRRTVSARLVKDILVVNAPEALSDRRLGTIITKFKLKFEKKKLKEEENPDGSLPEPREASDWAAVRGRMPSRPAGDEEPGGATRSTPEEVEDFPDSSDEQKSQRHDHGKKVAPLGISVFRRNRRQAEQDDLECYGYGSEG